MILVFASKKVGLEAVKLLLQRRDPVEQVIYATEGDGEIAEACRAASMPCSLYSPDVVARVVDAGRRYKWLLNAWSPHILRAPLLSLADHRANMHPSYVPYARGADSWAWILRKGLPAGVSILEMTAGIDAGGVYAQTKVELPFPMTGSALRDRLQAEMVTLFREAWPRMASGELVARDQAPGGTYHLRKETNLDRTREASDTSMSLGEVVQWALAHDFSPGTTAEMVSGGERYRVRVTVEKIPPASK
jgi:hypothetical protein